MSVRGENEEEENSEKVLNKKRGKKIYEGGEIVAVRTV